MANSISNIGSSTSAQRSQQNTALRNNPAVLNDIVRTQQKTADVRNRVALATPAGANTKTKLPRGSLVDVLA